MNAAFVRLRQPYRPVAGSDRLRLAYIGKAQNSIHFELGEAFPKPTNPPSSMYLPRQKTRGDKSGFWLCLAAPLVSFEVFTQGIARSAPPSFARARFARQEATTGKIWAALFLIFAR